MRGEGNAQARLDAGNPISGKSELHLFLLARVRRMISANRQCGAVAQRLAAGSRITSGAQRRTDTQIRVEGISGWGETFITERNLPCPASIASNPRIGQGDVVRRDITGEW
jgi:hypothetical protein